MVSNQDARMRLDIVSSPTLPDMQSHFHQQNLNLQLKLCLNQLKLVSTLLGSQSWPLQYRFLDIKFI